MIRWTTYVCWRTSMGSIFRNHWWSSLFTNHMYSTMALLISCAFAENKGYNWKCWSGGGFKSQSFKKKLWSKLEFLEGWEGSNQKVFCGRGIYIFLNNAFCCYSNVSLWSILARAKEEHLLTYSACFNENETQTACQIWRKIIYTKKQTVPLFHVLKKNLWAIHLSAPYCKISSSAGTNQNYPFTCILDQFV